MAIAQGVEDWKILVLKMKMMKLYILGAIHRRLPSLGHRRNEMAAKKKDHKDRQLWILRFYGGKNYKSRLIHLFWFYTGLPAGATVHGGHQ